MTQSEVQQQIFERDGFNLALNVVDPAVIDRVAGELDDSACNGPGRRLWRPPPAIAELIRPNGALGRLASATTDEPLRPVRILAFDKTPAANWGVGWHQDRRVALAEKRDAPGFENWAEREGVPHAEPPFSLLARMRSVRLHLDDCGFDDGPLCVIPGSHALGRLSETAIAELSSASPAVELTAARGDALVMAAPLVHRSSRAARPRQRRVLHVDFGPEALPHGLRWALELEAA